MGENLGIEKPMLNQILMLKSTRDSLRRRKMRDTIVAGRA